MCRYILNNNQNNKATSVVRYKGRPLLSKDRHFQINLKIRRQLIKLYKNLYLYI